MTNLSRKRRGRETELIFAEYLKRQGWIYAEASSSSAAGTDIKGVIGVDWELKARADFDPKSAMRQQAKRIKEAAALRALENKGILDKLKATADQKTLDDLKKKLDTERISLTYAMSQATDEATRLQLKGQLDLLDGNARAAAEDIKRMEELAAAKEAAEKRMQERTDLTAKAFDDLNIESTNLIKSIGTSSK
jgi:hypothetical protein